MAQRAVRPLKSHARPLGTPQRDEGQNMPVDPKEFWEAKLLGWEQGRYGSPDRPPGFLEWIANRSSASLRFRVSITPELLQPFLSNKHVVELDRKSTRLNSSHLGISYAVFCLKKK